MKTWARAQARAGSNYPFLTQKERDNETGLDCSGARYYANTQGRFTSPDDFLNDSYVEQPESWNKYAYVRNNPLRFVDPTGREAQVAIETDKDRKTGTIKIRASIAVYSVDGKMSKGDLDKRKDVLKAQIEKPFSGTFSREGVSYTVSADIMVTVAGSEKEAKESGADNIAGFAQMQFLPGSPMAGNMDFPKWTLRHGRLESRTKSSTE